APAAAIFELLARPSAHALLDGSGTVRGTQPGTPDRLSAGARFGMQMRWGLPYKILNEVVEFEEGRRIAWRHFAGHVWRWTLEPVDADTTRVSEQYDAVPSRFPRLSRLLGWPQRNALAIEASLDRLEDWARHRRS
ncbi:MAG: SRPBCC family protein, partial [Actinomycetes bacterium]